MKRALLVIRLSHLTDSSTSPERQREIGELACRQREWEVVDTATDLDVSATKFGPFDRPELGKWLNDRADEFDAIVCWRLDRLVRSSADLAKLIAWARENGKDIVSATEGFDLNTPFGRAMATIIGALAELEAETVRLRVQGAHAALRTMDRWASGVPPLGYVAVNHPSGHGKGLAIDPDAQRLVRDMAARLIEGDSFTNITTWLDESGELTSMDRARLAQGKPVRAKPWTVETVIRVLTSPATMGLKVRKDGSTVLDAEGQPLRMAEPLLDAETWELVQSAAAERRQSGRRRRHSINPLLGIGVCGRCGSQLAHQVTVSRDKAKTWRYARCGRTPVNCTGTSIPMADGLELLEEAFLTKVGHLEATRSVFVPGTDNRHELSAVRETIARLRRESDQGLIVGQDDEAEYVVRMRALIARRTELDKEPYRPSRWEHVGTGQTYSTAYAAADENGRRTLVRDSGIRFVIYRNKPLEFGVYTPDEAPEWLAAGTAPDSRTSRP
ncbi:MAG TPA: recombinase family protein [Pseudonocardiaceae bacterium]|nr:recombinase family protein [Pseudonocardiaceae bacterium]